MAAVPPVSDNQHAAGFARVVMAVALLGVLAWRVSHRPVDVPHPQRDPGYRIDVNHADVDTLQLLPGLGPSIAANVVARRETAGPFRSVEELEEVRMIGAVLRERMEPWVILGETPPASLKPTPSTLNLPKHPARDAGDAAPH